MTSFPVKVLDNPKNTIEPATLVERATREEGERRRPRGALPDR
jgi:hypothetical protein